MTDSTGVQRGRVTMSQVAKKIRLAEAVSVPGPPNGPLSPTQQQEGNSQVQAQADQRVKLGMRLLNAVQVQTSRQHKVLDEFRDQQQRLRDELHNDIASSLQTYDQWLAQFDQRFTARLESLEHKIQAMGEKWSATERQIAAVLDRAQQLLDQARSVHRSSPGCCPDQPAVCDSQPQKPEPPFSAPATGELRKAPSRPVVPPAANGRGPAVATGNDTAQSTPATPHRPALDGVRSDKPDAIYRTALQKLLSSGHNPPTDAQRPPA